MPCDRLRLHSSCATRWPPTTPHSSQIGHKIEFSTSWYCSPQLQPQPVSASGFVWKFNIFFIFWQIHSLFSERKNRMSVFFWCFFCGKDVLFSTTSEFLNARANSEHPMHRIFLVGRCCWVIFIGHTPTDLPFKNLFYFNNFSEATGPPLIFRFLSSAFFSWILHPVCIVEFLLDCLFFLRVSSCFTCHAIPSKRVSSQQKSFRFHISISVSYSGHVSKDTGPIGSQLAYDAGLLSLLGRLFF